MIQVPDAAPAQQSTAPPPEITQAQADELADLYRLMAQAERKGYPHETRARQWRNP